MMKTCKMCGRQFEEDGTSRKYCCKECSRKAANAQKIEWNTANRTYTRAVAYCRICGKPVEPLGHIRPRIHDECMIADILSTVSSGNNLSKTQLSRKYRLGLTNKEIRELLNAVT